MFLGVGVRVGVAAGIQVGEAIQQQLPELQLYCPAQHQPPHVPGQFGPHITAEIQLPPIEAQEGPDVGVGVLVGVAGTEVGVGVAVGSMPQSHQLQKH